MLVIIMIFTIPNLKIRVPKKRKRNKPDLDSRAEAARRLAEKII